eukprot:2649642-Amphidinium_carterae.1
MAFMTVICKLLELDADSPHPLLLAYVREMGLGWQQSKMVEEVNRVVRERETRTQNNKNMSRAR